MFDMDNYHDILQYASFAHGKQKTPKGLPYVVHVLSVATEIINACERSKLEQEKVDFAISCALLHDVIEDTHITYDDLYVKFSSKIADGVKSLSKNINLPKKEQMQDSLERILTQPHEVQMVKLADRIVNLSTPPKTWNNEKIKNYHKEAKLIHSYLKNANIYLSSRLEEKIKEYEGYMKRL